MLQPIDWISLGSFAVLGITPAVGVWGSAIKDCKKRNKFDNICTGTMLASALILALSMLASLYLNEKSDSKDATKTAQVQKLRTMVNNNKTANWNNFAQNVK